MVEKPWQAVPIKGPRPKTVGLLFVVFILFLAAWGSFVIVPAGHRGVVLLWGSVEKRIMGGPGHPQ
jgi:regulator of protease activity HflC (stomatin/prohibitin superfamily)